MHPKRRDILISCGKVKQLCQLGVPIRKLRTHPTTDQAYASWVACTQVLCVVSPLQVINGTGIPRLALPIVPKYPITYQACASWGCPYACSKLSASIKDPAD
eukprot:533879-Pelagomonas_calceolata.AAC.4